MYRRTEQYLIAQKSGVAPVFLAIVDSTRMRHVWGIYLPTDAQLGDTTLSLWDGSRNAGDGGTFGVIPVADFGARVLQFGDLSQSLTPRSNDLFISLQQTAIPTCSLTLDNIDLYFSTKLGMHRGESFLTKPLFIIQGYEGLGFNDFITIFQGKITYEGLSDTQFILRATSDPTLTLEAVASYGLLPLEDDGLGTMASYEYLYSGIYPVFLAEQDFVLSSTLIKDDWEEAGVIFSLVVPAGYGYGYSESIRMQWGIDANNHLYFTFCPDIQNNPSTTNTYTDTIDLSDYDFSTFQKVAMHFNTTEGYIDFISPGGRTRITIYETFDDADYYSDVITVGDGFDGQILTVDFNNQWAVENDDPNAVIWEDVKSPEDLDLTVIDGIWVT